MAEAKINHVSVEKLRELFSYDPLTGIVTRVKGRVDFLGPLSKNTMEVTVDDFKIRVNRLAWVLHYGYWPSGLVDHKDGDQQNNVITNLRDATFQQNAYNRVGTGKYPKGVVFKADAARTKPWSARIRIDGRKVVIGAYATMAEAAAAYQRKADFIQGEFAFHNSMKG